MAEDSTPLRGRNGRQVLVVAGEASSDLHCGMLISELKRLDPDLSFVGIGGNTMRDNGVRLIAHAKDLGVVGLSEVLGKSLRIIGAYRKAKALIASGSVIAALLVDYPEFNLGIAKHACNHGIPVLYYISPQVWAWRPARIKKIAQRVNKMLVLFQFEKQLYEEVGLDVEFVGHPLLDSVRPCCGREEFLRSLKLDPSKPVVALLPGSRTSEVSRLMPVMLRATELASSEFPDFPIQWVLALANTIDRGMVAKALASHHRVTVVQGKTYDALASSDAAVVASGTATLEATILGIPMIVCYKVSFTTYLLGRALIKLDHVALPNIIAGKRIVPELIQGDLNPHRLAKELLALLRNRDARLAKREELRAVANQLGPEGASRRAAAAASRFLQTRAYHPAR